MIYKIPKMKKRHIAESSLKLQNFYTTMDAEIIDILEVEDDEPPEAPVPTEGIVFKAANDTRWDSTRVLLKTRRDNAGESKNS